MNTNQKNPPAPDTSRKMEIARYYTKGDEEKSRLMLEGNYRDIYVFKVRFVSQIQFGAILLFFNRVYANLVDCYGIMSQAYTVDDIKITFGWQAFEAEISNCLGHGKHDATMTIDMLEKVRSAFSMQIAQKLIYLVQMKDVIGLGSVFKKEVLAPLNFPNIKADVGFEELSSLDMELLSKSAIKMASDAGAKKNIAETADIEVGGEDETEVFRRDDIRLIMEGALVLDPNNGMHISGLVVKDTIKVRIVDDNPRAILIAKAFNAYNDGRMLPIPGTIVSFRRKPRGGFKIFVEVTTGVYVRIDEEEANLKVAFVSASPDRPPELQKDINKYVDRYIEQQKRESEKNEPRAPESKQAPKSVEISPVAMFLLLMLLCVIVGIFVVLLLKILGS